METAALDIETTGTDPDDVVTVVGIDIPDGTRVMVNVGEEAPGDDVVAHVHGEFDPFVNVTAHRSEAGVLEACREFVADRLAPGRGEETAYKFAAYNGERWRGGFDLPFLRTRCQRNRVDWPFVGPYIDAMEVIASKFNTSDDSLETAYDELVGGDLTDRDPFDDSLEAVVAWEDGDYAALVSHNVADVRRTRQLVELAERYCSPSHFDMRSLEPIAHP